MTLPGFVHINGNLLAAVDVETTGREPGFHEIIQIGIQPLDSRCEPLKDVGVFYHTIKPSYKERADPKATAVHKLDLNYLELHSPDKWQVADWLDEWFTNLDLPLKKSLVPLAQNWAYEAGFLKSWLGLESFDQFFFGAPRDTMIIVLYLNDQACRRGRSVPFPSYGLAALCTFFGILHENPHDALADARAEAAVYKCLLEMSND